GLGVIPQRPADGLPYEELLLVGELAAEPEETPGVRRLLGSDLAQQGRSSKPQVGSFDPTIALGPGLGRMIDDQTPDEMGGDLIDQVPPGSFDDEPAIERQRPGHDEPAMRPGNPEGDVFLR